MSERNNFFLSTIDFGVSSVERYQDPVTITTIFIFINEHIRED